VLGEMRELGDRSVPEHEEIGRIAVRLGVGRLVLVGDSAEVRAIGDAALDEDPSYAVVRVPDVAAAVDHLATTVHDHDVVLVKASRGVALERVADGLLRSVGVAS
jgi:UDP-N-acetylmuramoyl-tripeptide--D-alanyl-D-alanine ligase